MLKAVVAYGAAVVLTYVVGTLTISQVNLASIIELGMEVDAATRIDAMLHDVMNMYQLYLPVVAVALLVAFPVAAGIIRFVPDLRLVGYVLAGFVAMIAIHVIFKALLGASGIAATRSLAGLLLQGGAGALGGLLFHYLTVASAAKSPDST